MTIVKVKEKEISKVLRFSPHLSTLFSWEFGWAGGAWVPEFVPTPGPHCTPLHPQTMPDRTVLVWGVAKVAAVAEAKHLLHPRRTFVQLHSKDFFQLHQYFH